MRAKTLFFDRRGGRLILGTDSDVLAWNLDRRNEPRLEAHLRRLNGIAFDPRHRWFFYWDNSFVGVWDLDAEHLDDAVTVLLKLHKGEPHDVEISPNGKWIAVAYDDCSSPDSSRIRFWNVQEVLSRWSPRSKATGIAIFSSFPDGRWLVSWGGSAGNLGVSCLLWKIGEQSNFKAFELPGHEAGVVRVVSGGTGRWVATVSETDAVRILGFGVRQSSRLRHSSCRLPVRSRPSFLAK